MISVLGRIFAPLSLALLGLSAHAEDVLITERALVQVRESVWTVTDLDLPKPGPDDQIIGAATKQDGARLLRIYNAKGGINGFAGIVYDNRDRGHSTLDPALFPSLAHLKYDAPLIENEFDFGLAGRLLLPAVVLGNSSTALRGGSAPRSLPRLAMTTPFWHALTALQYARNHIYVYPEHRDFDRADLFPINWPYMVISEGSSGSDQVFVKALAMTLAAMPRDTFALLRDKGLIAPTLQMILRRNMSNVTSRDDYLSGVAHPAAFNGAFVRTGRMVEQAAGLRPRDIPPLVRLRVVDEDFERAAGLARLDERLLDTPAAIGRLWRGFEWNRKMLVTAEDTVALNAQRVTFEWRLLRGDPARVRIEPLGPDGRSANISVDWHDPWREAFPGRKGPVDRQVSRVDIGVFANNGVNDSAPSFISIDFPEHEVRTYAPDSYGEMRLSSIDYDAPERRAYFDPLLYWTAGWSDRAVYDDNGLLTGWDRTERGSAEPEFVPHGRSADAPIYEVTLTKNGLPFLRIAQK